MKLGDYVKVTIDGIDYLARLVSYDPNSQMYGCSIYALGKVSLFETSDIEAL